MTPDVWWCMVITTCVTLVVAHVRHNSRVLRRTRETRCALHLVTDSVGNESLVMSVRLVDDPVLFMVDTAYAGAPVLSLWYLAVSRRVPRLPRLGSVQRRFEAIQNVSTTQTEVTDDEMRESVNVLLDTRTCRMFTSGCTMRLMGIGETSETQSDMLLCPSLTIHGVPQTADRLDADVFVTNPLLHSVHILTSDYMLHRAPCVIEPARGRIVFHATSIARNTFSFFDTFLVGGAFCVPMTVGGRRLQIVIDTGSSSCLAIGKTPGSLLTRCSARRSHVVQSGVNGEQVCSDLLVTDVRLGPFDVGDVEVFLNSQDVDGADGYAGLGLLKTFDLWMSEHEIGFRPNGWTCSTTSDRMRRAGTCPSSTLPSCQPTVSM